MSKTLLARVYTEPFTHKQHPLKRMKGLQHVMLVRMHGDKQLRCTCGSRTLLNSITPLTPRTFVGACRHVQALFDRHQRTPNPQMAGTASKSSHYLQARMYVELTEEGSAKLAWQWAEDLLTAEPAS